MTKRHLVVPIADGPEPTLPKYRYWGDTKPPQALVALAMASPRLSVDSTKATIRMYGPIDPWGGFWGVSAKEVAAALDGLEDTVTEVQLRVNSPGGSAWEGLAILNLLRAHPANITAVVDGLAASAASFIVAGCNDRVMSPGSQMMIHCASGTAWGCNASELRKVAGMLDKLDQSMADLYAEAAGGTSADWLAAMNEETWYTAKETVTAGLADRVGVVADAGSAATVGEDDDPADPLPLEGDPEDAFDLSMYRHPGRTKAPAPAAMLRTPKPPTASADGNTQPEGAAVVDLNDEQITALREQVGFPADADAGTIVAAVKEALAERAEPSKTTTPVVPEGMALVDSAVLQQIQSDAAAGREAQTTLATQARDNAINAALAQGKIAATSREKFVEAWDKDATSTQAILDALTPGLIPTAELGHGDEPQALGEGIEIDDAELDAFAASLGLTKEALRG